MPVIIPFVIYSHALKIFFACTSFPLLMNVSRVRPCLFWKLQTIKDPKLISIIIFPPLGILHFLWNLLCSTLTISHLPFIWCADQSQHFICKLFLYFILQSNKELPQNNNLPHHPWYLFTQPPCITFPRLILQLPKFTLHHCTGIYLFPPLSLVYPRRSCGRFINIDRSNNNKGWTRSSTGMLSSIAVNLERSGCWALSFMSVFFLATKNKQMDNGLTTRNYFITHLIKTRCCIIPTSID